MYIIKIIMRYHVSCCLWLLLCSTLSRLTILVVAFSPAGPSYRVIRSFSCFSAEAGALEDRRICWNRICADLTQRTLNVPLVINMTHYVTEPNVFELRHLQEEDISSAVRMIVQEYGSHTSPSTSSVSLWSDHFSSWMNYFENWSLGFVVSMGLHQRVQRRKIGQDGGGSMNNHDHNVLCLFEHHSSAMIGMVEVSMQPLDPQKTAPAYVLPTEVKTLLSRVTRTPHVPYVSNLLIEPSYRGQGYSKILMAACENLVLAWGYRIVYLHVDADDSSGRPAQALYRDLGYQPVVDRLSDAKFDWIDSDIIQTQGLYFVDGIPLLYLRKDLQ